MITQTDKKRFLDLFYEYYPEEYHEVFKPGMSTNEVYSAIIDNYPELFAELMGEYDRLIIR